MSAQTSRSSEEPGPSRNKRKNSDPGHLHEEGKVKAVDFLESSKTVEVLDDADDEDCNAKLGEYLSAQYEVLLRVLNNLSAFDLRRAAQVSKSWHSAVRVIRESRHQIHWLFWRANKGGWNVLPTLAVYSSICEHVHSQPTLCVAFFTQTAKKSFDCSSDIVCPTSRQSISCEKKHTMESYMRLALGPKCDILFFTVSGVIGTSLDLKSTYEVERISGKTQSMSAVLFPDYKGSKIMKFRLSKQELYNSFKTQSSTGVDLARQLQLPTDMLIQGLVLFSGYRLNRDEISTLVASFQSRQEHRFAVAGGIGENPDSIEGLVIMGDNVCAASIVIPETVTEIETVNEYVNKLKNCNLPSEQSLCFIFTCLGRGALWYEGAENIESRIILKTFPKTPVVGFFGRGEIGWNFLPNFPVQDSKAFWESYKTICSESKASLQDPPKPVKRGQYSCEHSYSSCLLYLAFNSSTSTLPL